MLKSDVFAKQRNKPTTPPKEIKQRKFQLKSENLPPIFSPPENDEHISHWFQIMERRLHNLDLKQKL